MKSGNRLVLIICLFLASHGYAAVSQPDLDPLLRDRLIQAVNDSQSFEDRYQAEVWLFDMAQRLRHQLPDTSQRLEFLRLVHREATQAELPPELVLAVIEVESNFNRWAISRSGALGLMQVMPFWLNEIGRPGDNLLQPETNLRLGCTILKYYLDMEQGELRPALARYNGSYGKNKYPDRVLRALSTRWYRQ